MKGMLKLNKVLEFFHLVVDWRDLFFDIEYDFVRELHNELLPVVRSPLPLECRLAFITKIVFGAL